MRKITLILLFALVGFYQTSVATTVTVYVSGIGLNPATTSATCGDTIKWKWNGGTDSVRSTTIPGCATSWKSPVGSGTPTFTAVVGCAGSYSYNAYVLNGSVTNYTGTINVTCATGIPAELNVESVSMYPNPGNGHFVLATGGTELQGIQVFDLKGSLVFSQSILDKTSVDLAGLDEGIYLVRIYTSAGILSKKLIISK
jgi:plastocyanin